MAKNKPDESITKDQARGMVLDAIMLGIFKPIMHQINGTQYVVYLRNPIGTDDHSRREYVFWGSANDLQVMKNPIQVEQIMALISLSYDIKRYKVDNAD